MKNIKKLKTRAVWLDIENRAVNTVAQVALSTGAVAAVGELAFSFTQENFNVFIGILVTSLGAGLASLLNSLKNVLIYGSVAKPKIVSTNQTLVNSTFVSLQDKLNQSLYVHIESVTHELSSAIVKAISEVSESEGKHKSVVVASSPTNPTPDVRTGATLSNKTTSSKVITPPVLPAPTKSQITIPVTVSVSAPTSTDPVDQSDAGPGQD